MIDYTTLIKNKSGDTVTELPQTASLTCGWYLNAPGAVTFELPKQGSDLSSDDITLGFTEIEVYRNNSLLQAGEIQTRSGALNQGMIQYGAKGWLSLLEARLVGNNIYPTSYNEVGLSAILDNMIVNTQIGWGNIGLTVGTLATSRTAIRNYQFDTVKSAIEGLSNSNISNGLDIEITPGKVINSFYPQRGRVLDLAFSTGTNIIDHWVTEDATALTNKLTLLGAGDGANMLTSTSQSPDYLLNSYRLRERTLSFKDISDQTTLDERAESERLVRQVPKQIVTIHVTADDWGAYDVGDSAQVDIDDGLIQVHGLYRMYGIELTRSNLGRETAKIIFNPN
jgi:hypothetical protein